MSRPQCQFHSLPLSYICLSSLCSSHPTVCQKCKQTNHKAHMCKTFNLIDQLNIHPNISNQNLNTRKEIVERMSKVFKSLKEFEVFQEILGKMIVDSYTKIQSTIIPTFNYLNLFLMGKLGSEIIDLTEKKQDKKVDEACKLLKYLSNSEIKSKDFLLKLMEKAGQKFGRSLDQLRNRIASALQNFDFEMASLTLNNWTDLYEQEILITAKEKEQKHIKNYQSSNVGESREASIDDRIERQIARLFNDVFNTKENIHNNSAQQQIKQIKVHQIPSQSDDTEVLKSSNHTPSGNQYRRYVIKSHKNTEKLTKEMILSAIESLSIDPCYSVQLRQFIIQGCNQFDVECLQKLATKFPELQKFNYVWDFQEQSLRLQKQQIFSLAFHSFSEKDGDLKISKLNQKVLDIYGKFENLHNIAITNMVQLTYDDIRIKNKKIQHISLGEYIQSWQYDQIPISIKRQVLTFRVLVTLNLFNIKKVDGDFFEKVFAYNKETLKNIWLSECIQIEEKVLRVIGSSKLQSIIFQQIKRIDHPFQIPSTIKTLIFENCAFSSEMPLVELDRATNLQNFSIFQSSFQNAQKIGDKVIQDISRINPCNIEYLNVGECKSVTNYSLINLPKMRKLKDLCVDNTNIDLLSISKAEECLRNLQRLAIVGLPLYDEVKLEKEKFSKQINYKTRIQKILKRAPKLKTICLKYDTDISKINQQYFRNVEHITFHFDKAVGRYKQKGFQSIKNALQNMGKNIAIVPS